MERVREWQPISTAPKDGTWMLMWSEHWRDGGKPTMKPVIAMWSRFGNCFVDYDSSIYMPTHWMALPEPPK